MAETQSRQRLCLSGFWPWIWSFLSDSSSPFDSVKHKDCVEMTLEILRINTFIAHNWGGVAKIVAYISIFGYNLSNFSVAGVISNCTLGHDDSGKEDRVLLYYSIIDVELWIVVYSKRRREWAKKIAFLGVYVWRVGSWTRPPGWGGSGLEKMVSLAI